VAIPKWLMLADEFVETALESLTRRVQADDLSPEVTIAAINAVTQRTTTHRAVIVERDDPSGPAGDRRDCAAAIGGTTRTRKSRAVKRPGKRGKVAPPTGPVDTAGE
jgi:hypothetical protein